MARRRFALSTQAWLLAAVMAGGSAGATPPPPPEDFLEYLGSWGADDADWLVAAHSPGAARATSTLSASTAPTRTTISPESGPRSGTQPPDAHTERKP